MLESWTMDTRFALRRLRKRPTYAALVALTLALGVAGTAAVFGVARRLLLDPLPVRGEEQIVAFWFGGAWNEQELHYLRPEMTDFEAVAAMRHADATLDRDGEATRLVRGLSATAELFSVLGTPPALGPGFRAGDDVLGADPVVVLSHSLWQELGGRASIVGDRIDLAGTAHTVAGVMPAGFWFPDPTVDIWLAEQIDPEEQIGNYTLIGRMRPGLAVDGMGPQLERITRMLDERYDFPEQWDLTKDPKLTPLREHLVGSVRPALLALLGAMALLLLIACVNVAALMLGQVDARGTELAVRAALGAGRRRLLQQLVAESVVLGAFAGLLGSALAGVGFQFLVRALPLGALAETAVPDWTLFVAAMAVALAAASAVALAPGLSVARSEVHGRLGATRTGGIGGRGGRLESVLVVAQVALVLLIASGAALLIRSVANLRAIDPGVDVEGVAVLDVVMPQTIATERRPQVVGEMVRALEALPAVRSAAATQRLPLRGSSDNWGIGVEGSPELETTTTAFRVVTPAYFDTMGIEVRSGRGLLDTDRDPGASEGAVVINEALAETYFPGRDPLGRRIAFMERWDRIVGVVENVAEASLSAEPFPARYMVYEQVPLLLHAQTIVVRTERGHDPESILDEARRAIQAAAPGVAVRELTTMSNVFRRAIGPALQVMSLLTLLGALGLTLGSIGVYGVVSHFVARRQRDWGIRIALGMPPPTVIGRIVARGGALMVAGIALGLTAFLALARLLTTFLYGVGATDFAALAGAAALLLGAGLLATLVPARRASRIDPAVVLREQ
jgi:predicted permease